MARKPLLCFVFCIVAITSLVGMTGCGDPSFCNNDSDCKDGLVCVRQVCDVAPVKDASGAVENLPDEAKPDLRTPPERPTPERPAPERTLPEPPPERSVPDLPAKKDGDRKEGDVCDPREHAYFYDRCAPGLGCAEYAQTAPTSGAPQPYGICIKGCSEKDPSVCPTGTKCAQTSDTKTRQPTGIWVCGREVKEGDLCVNSDACADGLSCTKFGTTGTNWTCQKDCTADASVCSSGFKCEAAQEGSQINICKQIAKAGEVCSDSVTCDAQSYCFEANRFGAFSKRCRKQCTADTDCGTGQHCVQFSVNGKPTPRFCMDKATQGQECNRGITCTPDSNCIDLATSYATCYKRCSSNTDCPSPLICAAINAQTATKVCKAQLQAGDPVLDLGDCAPGTRGIQLAEGVVICLPDCSAGTSTNPTRCGKITPGTMLGVIPHVSRGFIAVGELGVLAQSGNGGSGWQRTRFVSKQALTGIAASSDGQTLLISGHLGTLGRSEDGGKTWALVSLGSVADLKGVALTSDGMTALVVGPKGAISRSEDGGKTWAPVALSPAVTEDFNAVAFARETGTGTTAALAFAVGTKGTVLRSEDAGKTWAPVTGVSVNIHSISLLRDRTATGLFGVLVGDAGEIWTSSDEGKTWTKETSGVPGTLHAVHHDGTNTVAVGINGVILERDSAAMWTKLATNSTTSLRAIAIKGNQWTAVGALGTSINSPDAGKTWAVTGAALLQCVGLTSNGQPSGGVCLFRCASLAKGDDCPFGLNTCGSISLGATPTPVCFPSAPSPGTASANEPCNTYPTSPASSRCKPDHVCGFVGTGFFCLRRCSDTLKCDTGDTCAYVNAIGGTFCGKTIAKDQPCSLGEGNFCEPGHTCVLNRLNGKATCQTVTVAKEAETCDATRRPCEKGLICSGLGSTPYRRFCTKTCNPTGTPTGCSTGWDCLQTAPGSGICVERCTTPDHKCTATHVRCQEVTTSGNSHCL